MARWWRWKANPFILLQRGIMSTNDAARPLTILFEDAAVLAIDKAPNVLSVPGKVKEFDGKSRNEEWHDAIRHASSSSEGHLDPLVKVCLERIAATESSSVPRKEERFYAYLARSLKVKDSGTQQAVWAALTRCDAALHKVAFDDIPVHLRSAADLGERHCGHKLYHVHRLDMETSGVLVYAKTEAACADLGRQFRDRLVRKVYVACVAHPYPSVGHREEVHLPMRADLADRPRQVVDEADGKPCTTHVEALATLAPSGCATAPTSLVKLTPITGRSHQLRVHLAATGHPMLGDTLYAPPDIVTWSPGRLCLHAASLSFTHPVTGAPMTLTSLHECDFVEDKAAVAACLSV